MRLDLVAAWVLSLPIAAASPVASVPSVAVEHTANPAGDCLPGWRTSTVPLLPESRGLDPTTKCVPLNRSTKDFVVQVGEDALLFSVTSLGTLPLDNAICGEYELEFTGIDGREQVVTSAQLEDPLSLQVKDHNQELHTIQLELSASSDACAEGQVSTSTTQTITGRILSIDGGAVEPASVFFIDLRGPQRTIVDVWDGVSDSILHTDLVASTAAETFLSGHLPQLRDGDLDHELHDSDDSLVSASTTGLIETNSADAAIRLLELSEKELESLKSRLETQRQLVQKLTGGKYPIDDSVIKDCETWHCVLRKLFQKSKACVHAIYRKVTTFVKQKENGCPRMAFMSVAKKQMGFSTGTSEKSGSCDSKSSRPDTKDYSLLSESKDEDYSDASDSDTSSIYSTFHNTTRQATSEPSLDQASLRQSLLTTHKIHAALALVLSLLCLGCLTTFLHRRCCNPRAKADRRARREEAANAREYARAARQHSWRIWWAKHLGLGNCLCCGGRKDTQRIADYEEKRGLILQQEDRLEGYMQEEIRFLTGSVAEEGRVGIGPRIPMPVASRRSMHESSEGRRYRHRRGTRQTRANTGTSRDSTGDDTLPSYRSRDSSSSGGRPPSYRTTASSSAQPPLQSGVSSEERDHDGVINEELASRLTRSFPPVRNSRDSVDWLVSDDESPDSSVVDVSPRLSSETIRTELSAFGL